MSDINNTINELKDAKQILEEKRTNLKIKKDELYNKIKNLEEQII